MKQKILAVLLVVTLCAGTASAQLGSGIVYDPTNYQNALLRYQQLQQHLLQLQRATTKSRTISTLPCKWPSSSRTCLPVTTP